jgi:hypothetical protein
VALTDAERKALHDSAEAVRSIQRVIDNG